jgi:hypothetical protein
MLLLKEGKMFILIENTMNGTVTMQTFVTGYNLKTFKQAVKSIKKSIEDDKSVRILKDDDKEFSFMFDAQFPLYGSIKNEEITIINK